jgi:hypothetical protein
VKPSKQVLIALAVVVLVGGIYLATKPKRAPAPPLRLVPPPGFHYPA